MCRGISLTVLLLCLPLSAQVLAGGDSGDAPPNHVYAALQSMHESGELMLDTPRLILIRDEAGGGSYLAHEPALHGYAAGHPGAGLGKGSLLGSQWSGELRLRWQHSNRTGSSGAMPFARLKLFYDTTIVQGVGFHFAIAGDTQGNPWRHSPLEEFALY
ncbi:hypothetical protein IIA79_02345 [bacterium]|nr:hypothetical protein [bacterium]